MGDLKYKRILLKLSGEALMGEKGYGYEQILLHYFRGAQLEKIY